ncbi:MAG: type I 3-dehydroquinate dehydratase [Clostridia bacterium]|nr:type I 3-dehydroquinate dehydratase [Clostridia bacterium]
MKATFLNQTRPLITGMIQKTNPDEMRLCIKNSIADGADCLGVQLETLAKEYKTEESYKKIFAACGGHPIYVTNYRGGTNTGLSDEELMDGLLTALRCGGTLGDVMGCAFDPEVDRAKGYELSMKQDAIDKQMHLIDRIHEMGKEALMSSHVLTYTPAEKVLEIAYEHQRRGADIVKIVTAGNSVEEEMENLRITALLKKELKVPFLFLSGGTHSKVHRRIGPQLGCVTYLAVQAHDNRSVPTQPTVKEAKAIRDNFDYLPDVPDTVE